MELRTILVNLDIDFYSPNLLKAAVDLAQRFGARIIAVAAAAAPTELIAVEGAAVSVGLYEAERAQVEDRLNGLEAEFRESVPAALRDNCLVHLGAPNPILTRVARRADLILIRSHLGGEEVRSRNLDVGELLLAVGRPVLLVEPDCATVKADSIVVAWKDSREARRAVSDALPLLKKATQVVVAGIDDGDRINERVGVDDVIAWLRLHDARVRGDVYPAVGSHGDTLQKIAREAEADLIVAGAYGHSRMREWIFGGVTRDLLAAPTINRFMSN